MSTNPPRQPQTRHTHQSQQRARAQQAGHHPPPPRRVHHSQHAHIASATAVFIEQSARPAQTSEAQTGVPASVTIAQAIVESGWGRYHMGAANNYFGIKAFSRHGRIDPGSVATGSVDRTTHEYEHGRYITIVAHFRSYNSMADSFTDHGLLLKHNQRYARGFIDYERTGNADLFAEHLQRAGYATDPHYASMLIGLMRRYNLYRFDARRATPGAR